MITDYGSGEKRTKQSVKPSKKKNKSKSKKVAENLKVRTEPEPENATNSTTEVAVDMKMNKVREMLKENEELKTEIKAKETELSQLKSKSEKEVAVFTTELDSLESDLKDSVDTKMKAEQEMRRLQVIVETCVENITRLEEEKKAKGSLIERNMTSLKATEDNLTEEIENLRASLDSRLKTVDSLMREGVTAPVISPEKQRLISFLSKTMEEKEEAIREKESDLECPVCLETAGGEIFCCVEQHLVCYQCRPRVVECPQCRQSYPPTPLRHRYAEKMAGQLERLREELGRIVVELNLVSG